MTMTSKKIKDIILNTKDGELFTSKDFLHLGNRSTIDKTLSRMVLQGEIKRARRGMFFRPIKNRFVGEVPIGLDAVIKTMIDNGEVLQVHGAEAARRLKLSTQVPLKRIFYTNRTTRSIKIGNREIKLIHTSDQRKLQYAGTNIGLAISALWYLGEKLVTTSTINALRSTLKEEEFRVLTNANLTGWMTNIINKTEMEVRNEKRIVF